MMKSIISLAIMTSAALVASSSITVEKGQIISDVGNVWFGGGLAFRMTTTASMNDFVKAVINKIVPDLNTMDDYLAFIKSSVTGNAQLLSEYTYGCLETKVQKLCYIYSQINYAVSCNGVQTYSGRRVVIPTIDIIRDNNPKITLVYPYDSQDGLYDHLESKEC